MTSNPGLPQLHTPEEVGKPLGRSGWWVREQCRRGRFPHTRAGGAIRFTAAQVTEVLRILEHRPEQGQPRNGSGAAVRAKPKASEKVVQLQARPPRRARKTG